MTRRRPIRGGVPALVAALAAAAGGACDAPAPAPENARPLVVATMPPLAWLADAVGGEAIEVRTLLGPRDDPEASPFSVEALRTLERADLVMATGAPALAAERRLLEASGGGPPRRRGERRVVRLCEAAEGCAEGLRLEAHDGHGEDPHLWLDPDVMVAAARSLAAELRALRPELASEIGPRLAELERQVARADARILERLESRAGGVLFVDHPTWRRFAVRYGVRMLALEREELEPGPRGVRAVIDEARRLGAPALAVTAGGRQRLARAVARELGIPTVELEPLAYDWLSSLERAATLVAAAPEPADG